MTTRIAPPRYTSGRHPIMSGNVMIGALFPPPREGAEWEWLLFQLGSHWGKLGTARTEEAARKAVMGAWRSFLHAAELTEE